jgi:DNA (cytosine-5)-methyltransferase 1
MRPRLLDLFCGAGGASVGYHRAGFDVVGVDLHPQPNYPYEFHQADALTFPLDGFDAIHASPTCQTFSLASAWRPGTKEKYPDLVTPMRLRLHAEATVPFVIENVPGAPIRQDVLLCGEMFGLRLHRHRYFETEGFLVMQPAHSGHRLKGALTNCHIEAGYTRQVAGNFAGMASASEAMGIDWMTRLELAEAIPPAYTEFIGGQLLDQVNEYRLLGFMAGVIDAYLTAEPNTRAPGVIPHQIGYTATPATAETVNGRLSSKSSLTGSET